MLTSCEKLINQLSAFICSCVSKKGTRFGDRWQKGQCVEVDAAEEIIIGCPWTCNKAKGIELVKNSDVDRIATARRSRGRFLGCFGIRNRDAYCGDFTAVRDQDCSIPRTMSADISIGINGGNRFVHRLKACCSGYISGVAIRVRCSHSQGNLYTGCLRTEL